MKAKRIERAAADVENAMLELRFAHELSNPTESLVILPIISDMARLKDRIEALKSAMETDNADN